MFWERNYFGDLVPVVHAVITNNYLRGAISGLGLVNIWFALSDLAGVVGHRADSAAVPGPDA